MRFKDLPRSGLTKKPLNRKIYEFFWSPFQICLDILSGAINSLKAGMVVAAAGYMVVMGFMFFLDELTLKLAGGIGIICMISGLSVSLFMGLIRAFR